MTGVNEVTVHVLDTTSRMVDMVVVVETTPLGRLAVEGVITVGSVLNGPLDCPVEVGRDMSFVRNATVMSYAVGNSAVPTVSHKKLSAAVATPLLSVAKPTKAAMWRHLFEHPREWLEFRQKKATAEVKDTYPDFKHYNNEGWVLWFTSQYGPALAWVTSELATITYEFSDADANPVELARVAASKRARGDDDATE